MAAVLLFPCRANALSARHAVLLDAMTGRVLYEKDADTKALIASTTKIMTAYLVSEYCNVLDRVKIPKEAVGIEGSSLYLQEGEILTVQELLYGLMLHSGNDAAVALAIYCGGSVEGFVSLMNDKAHGLGLTNTRFANPHGLDHPDHYSSAMDLAILTSAAMKNPIFAKTVSARNIKIGNRYLKNHNKLLWMVDGADGVKTGYTKAAGRILVSSAVRNERRMIAVTIHAPDDWNDHKAMLESGFRCYQVESFGKAGDILMDIPVLGGQESSVEIASKSDIHYSVAPGEKVEFRAVNPGFVYAPVVEGQDAGFVYMCVDGVPMEKIPVYYTQTVEQLPEAKKDHFWNGWFRGD